MPEFFIDHGAYPAFIEPPAWGVAYDGDGTLATPAGSVSIGSIDFAASTAAATNTITIAGAVLTCVASGAVANQFNAGTTTALAANVVAAINAATSTVASTVSYARPQLRDWVFARVNPVVNTQVQIMTRAGSTRFNHAINTAVAIATSGLTGAPTIVQMIGGASGCWGVFMNMGNVLPSALTQGGYSALAVNIADNRSVLAVQGQLTGADTVWMRANNQVLEPVAAAYPSGNMYSPYRLILDADNRRWADTLGKTFTLRSQAADINAQTYINLSPGTGQTGACRWRIASTTRNSFIFQPRSQSGAGPVWGFGMFTTGGTSREIIIERITFFNNGSNSQSVLMRKDFSVTANHAIRYVDCDFRWSQAAPTGTALQQYSGNQNSNGIFEYDGCRFTFDSMSGTVSGLVAPPALQTADIVFKNCTAAAAGTVFLASGQTSPLLNIRASNNRGFGTQTFGRFGQRQYGAIGNGGTMVSQQAGAKRATIVETGCTLLAWIPDSGFPTLRAFMQDGTYWSWRATWTNSASMFAQGCPIDQLAISKQAPPTNGVRTVTLEILVPPEAAAVGTKDMALNVGYIGADGVLRTETTIPLNEWLVAAVPFAASSQAWSFGSFPSYLRRQLQVTTSVAVLASSDMMITLQFMAPAPVANAQVFVDPEPEIA